MAERLTVRTIERLIAAAKPKEVRDASCPGLILRIRERSWSWTIRWSPGKGYMHLRIDLGADLTLDEARELADKFREVARSALWTPAVKGDFLVYLAKWRARRAGIPEPVKPEPLPPPPPPSITYKEAVELWRVELGRTRRDTTAKEYSYALTGAELRPLLERRVDSVRRTEMAEIVAAIHARGAERHAEVVALVVKELWRFLGEDRNKGSTGVDGDEMRGLKAPERTLVEDDEYEKKLHVPDAKEVGVIVRKLRSLEMLERDRLAALLLVHTIQRRRYVALARKSDFEAIGDGTGLWKMPPRHRKSASRARRKGHDIGFHIVPLPAQAWAVVERAIELAGESEFLFPAVRDRRAGGKPSLTMDPGRLDKIFQKIGCITTPHDMRRALATTYRIHAGYTVAEVGLILDHGAREDNVGAERVTVEHYAFSGVGRKAWEIMRGWCQYLEAAAIEHPAPAPSSAPDPVN